MGLLIIGIVQVDGAKGGGGAGRGGARGRGGRGRMYGSRMPILIPSRNPGAINYYENKDVGILFISLTFSIK